MADAASNLD